VPVRQVVPEVERSSRVRDGLSAVGSYEELVAAHAEQFRLYLQRMLDRQAEGRGGRIPVDDTLQEALLRIYERWPEFQGLDGGERDRRLYRCLRDAAVKALRAEYGERTRHSPRARFIAYDFGSVEESGDDLPAVERELTAAVLGSMVRDIAEAERGRDVRAMLSRGVLVAGLRALSEEEAVVLIAVDHLGWDQHQLAEQLGTTYEGLRHRLFLARKIFYALVRHATGLEVDEEERARLVAHRAGELTGAERRTVGRHLKHCARCQALDAEQRIFGAKAVTVLSPLSFLSVAKVLAKRSAVKGSAGAGGAGAGLFGQAGAAKAAAVVMGILGIGGGASAVLAALADHAPHGPGVAAPAPFHSAGFPVPAGMRRITVTVPSRASSSPTHKTAHHHTTHKQPARHDRAPAHAPRASTKPSANTVASHPTTTAAAAQAPATTKPSRAGGQSCEFFCG
jgi:DNA-directed RNA polymerase specialized sigma24 family protein